MPPEENELLLEELKETLQKLGIEYAERDLTDDELVLKGGLCTVKGRRIMIIGRGWPVSVKIRTILENLSEDDIEGLYLPPKLRDTIENHEKRF